MPAQNYVLLERVEVGEAGASSITFNSIPQTGYTDLKVVVSARTTTGGVGGIRVNPNGLATNLSERSIDGAGSGTPTSSATTQGYSFSASGSTDTANTFSNCEAYFPNYTSSNYKSWGTESVTENNATTAYSSLSANLWSSTAAITSLTITMTNPFARYSSASLYALAAVGTTPTKAPKATGGSIIQTDGTYWYHAFLASGTFTPAVGLSCDVLVVAGGGGGGSNGGGGGGAGGLSYQTSRSVSAASTVTIGSGGASQTSGTNSVFDTITSNAGGGGASGVPGQNASNGGSGGGGRYVTYTAGGTSTQGNTGGATGFGFAGGTGVNYGWGAGAGGGGAGAVGAANPSAANAGAGGAGVNTYSTWATATATGVSGFYAGGGGGGIEPSGTAGTASGGGGAGSVGGVGTAGTPNTGGGGGGGWTSTTGGGKGGSGIVIIRYAV